MQSIMWQPEPYRRLRPDGVESRASVSRPGRRPTPAMPRGRPRSGGGWSGRCPSRPGASVAALVKPVPDRPNIELRRDRGGDGVVVLAFPYDRELVEQVRTIPPRRFDWETREGSAPAADWAGVK